MLSSDINPRQEEEGLQTIEIAGHRLHENRYEYLVRWVALSADHDTWKVEEELGSLQTLLDAYKRENGLHDPNPSQIHDTVSAEQHATTAKTTFFDLPLEIRNLIYGLVLYTPNFLWLKKGLFCLDKERFDEAWAGGKNDKDYKLAYNYWLAYSFHQPCQRNARHDRAFLLSSRQIYHEASAVLFADVTLCMSINEDFDIYLNRFRAGTLTSKNNFRSLYNWISKFRHVTWVCDIWKPDLFAQVNEVMSLCSECFNSCPDLQKRKIVYNMGEFCEGDKVQGICLILANDYDLLRPKLKSSIVQLDIIAAYNNNTKPRKTPLSQSMEYRIQECTNFTQSRRLGIPMGFSFNSYDLYRDSL